MSRHQIIIPLMSKHVTEKFFNFIPLGSASTSRSNNVEQMEISSSDSGDDSAEEIVENNSIEINQDFIITLFNQNHAAVDEEMKQKCKILKLSRYQLLEDIRAEIADLDAKIFQNLFIIEISMKKLFDNVTDEEKNKENFEKFMDTVHEFSKDRPILLRITLTDQDKDAFFVKDEVDNENESDGNLDQIRMIEDIESYESDSINNFESLLCAYINNNEINLDANLTNKILNFENSSLALRILRILKLKEGNPDSFVELIKKCAAEGSVKNLLAVLDIPFLDEKGISENEKLQIHLSDERYEILSTAVKNSNHKVTDYLVINCWEAVKGLPYEHKLQISTESSNQYELLHKLLEFCDFPFPKNFNESSRHHPMLLKVINRRKALHKAIEEDCSEDIVDEISPKSFQAIEIYNKAYKTHKFAFDLKNNTAFYKAVNLGKFKLIQKLKYFGFEPTEYDEFSDICKIIQQNIESSISPENKTIHELFIKTRIHCKDISKDKSLYWHQIRMWIEEIYGVESFRQQLHIVAECENLKIIFDFEYESISNVDLNETLYSNGVMYPVKKWIIIGAKLTNENGKCNKDKIRGVIAHELCHYAMFLRYENSSKPYYKHDIKSEKKFRKVVSKILEIVVDNTDDECESIISNAIVCYSPEFYHAELIVRVPQIMSHYLNNDVKIKNLEKKYQPLFGFYKRITADWKIISFKNRKVIRKFNLSHGQVNDIKNLEYELTKNINVDFYNQVAIIVTNSSKLFLLNIFNAMKPKFGVLMDVQNIFITANKFKNIVIFSDLKENFENYPNTHIFIDCSKGVNDNLKELLNLKKSKLTFIVSSIEQHDEIKRNLDTSGIASIKQEILYNWNDLTSNCQHQLLLHQVEFQKRDSKFKVVDLITNFAIINEPKFSIKSLEKNENSELLDRIINKQDIIINLTRTKPDKDFDWQFQLRNFIRKEIIIIDDRHKYKESKINQEELLNEIKDKIFVVLSDHAGTGKSWVMKNFEIFLRNQDPMKWTTLVDLKEFIEEFRKAKGSEPKFIDFLSNKILTKMNYEKFELELLMMMYENGRVCILFDGFDEVAPDCTDFVTRLIKSFKSKGNNQLWIATRDFFEKDLLKILSLDVTYSLEPFTQENGIDLITMIWLNKCFPICEVNINALRETREFKNFKNNAEFMMEEFSCIVNNLIGLPLLCKILGSFSDVTSPIKSDISFYEVFGIYVKKQIEMWSHEKGDIRKESSLELQSKSCIIGYVEVHQFFAMQGYFPDKSSFCDLKVSKTVWTDDKIMATGLMTKKGKNLFFVHETFRDYFAADFIKTVLLKSDRFIDEEFCEYLVEFLTNKKHNIIRLFLDEALEKDKDEIANKLLKISEILFRDIEKLAKTLTNHNNIQEFLIKIFSFGNYTDVKKLFSIFISSYENIKFDFITETKPLLSCHKNLVKLLLRFFTNSDLKELLLLKTDGGVTFIHEFVYYTDELEIVDALKAMKQKLFLSQYQNLILKRDEKRGNLVQAAMRRENSKVFFYLLNDYEMMGDKYEEIRNMLSYSDSGNHLRLPATRFQDPRCHEQLWNILKKYFNETELKQMVKNSQINEKRLVNVSFCDKTDTLKVKQITNHDIASYCLNVLNQNSDFSDDESFATENFDL